MMNNINNNNDNIGNVDMNDNNDNNVIVGYMDSTTGPRYSIPVLVFIEISKDAITNLNRNDIVDPLNASYNTNKFKIIKIIDEELNEYHVCKIDGNEVEKNEEVIEDDMCHAFFLTKKRAIHSMISYARTGHIIEYHDNGQKEEEYMLNEKRQKTGKYTKWEYDTTLLLECNYLNGTLEGEYKKYQEGKLIEHLLYSDGNIIEYFDYDLTKNKINKIYDKSMDKFNLQIENMDLTNDYNKVKTSKKSKRKESAVFSLVVNNLTRTIAKLSSIKTKNNEIILYNNLKKMDIIKKMCEIINTPYGKSYLNSNLYFKKDISTEMDEFIEQFDKKAEVEYQQFKLYLLNIKNTIFV